MRITNTCWAISYCDVFNILGSNIRLFGAQHMYHLGLQIENGSITEVSHRRNAEDNPTPNHKGETGYAQDIAN